MRAREFLITESKNSDRYYHGTRKDLDGFRPLTHFGTFRAAYDRLLDTNTGSNTKNQKIYQVTLDIKNPVELQDISKNHKLSDWISMMKLQEYITSEEAESISTPRQLIKLLISKGYDGINYMNEWEDPGSDSYVIFKPEQVKIKDVITFDQQRKITRLLKEVIKKSDTSKAEQWIKKVYSKLQPHPFNRDEYIMGFSPEEFAVIKLSPSKFGKETDVVYVDWFQAYPLGAGVGQKAMKILQKMAAEDDISLALFPWAKGKISQKSLVKFYKKQGFTTGKRGSTMTWHPTKQGVAEGVEHNQQDLDDVADWLNTTPDNLSVEVKQEPIEKFIKQIREMYGTYDEFPEDEERTSRILKLLKRGAKPLPIYVEANDPDLFVMEGRHRMVAFWIAGMKTIPVAYASKNINENFADGKVKGMVEGSGNNTTAQKIFFARSNIAPKGWSYDHVGFITQDGKQIQMSGHKGNEVYVTNAVTDDPEFPKQKIKIVSLSKPVSVPTTNSVGAENCGTFVANVLQANGIKGIDTQKLYSVMKEPLNQGVAEGASGMFSKVMGHETSPEDAKKIQQQGFKNLHTGIFFNTDNQNYSGGGYGGTVVMAKVSGPMDKILNLEDDNNLPNGLDEFADGEEIADYARSKGYWAWTDGVQFAVLDPKHTQVLKQGVAENSGDTIEIPSGKSKLVKRTIPRYWYHSLHGRELGPKGEILPYKYGKETKIFQDELFRDPKPNGFVYLSPQPLASDSIKIDASKLDPSLMRLTGQVEGYAIYAGAIPAEAQVEDKSLTEAKVKPITAYHGTRRKITKFEPFTHFGSPQAAKDRLDHTLYGSEEGAEKDMIYKVKLNISNPMKLFGDYDKNHDLSVYKDLIADADHMTPDEYKNINSLDELNKFILSKGYDGLTYTNRYEGIGTKSYVILDPSQVTIEKVYKYPDTYKVKESVI